jgi:MFS family permease
MFVSDAQAHEPQAPEPQVGDANEFPWYVASMATWFAAFGLQTILFPHIVLNELHSTPFMTGVAQMSLMLPSLLLVIFGGVVADHVELRGFLAKLHIAAVFPPLVMTILYFNGILNFTMVIIYALCMGILTAFATPARDTMLSHIVGDNLQKGVAGAMGTQFGAQLIGIALASTASIFGFAPLLAIQSVIYLLGVPALYKLRPADPHPKTDVQSRRRELVAGFTEIANAPSVWPFCLVMFGAGIFYIGPFMVGIPVFIRDVFGGTSVELAISSSMFMVGTIISTVTIMRLGQIKRIGRTFILAISSGMIMMVIMSLEIPFIAFISLVGLWGIGAGIAMSTGRLFVQESARASHRARVLSVYALCFMGGAPIGSLLIGIMIEKFGLRAAFLIDAAGMFCILVFVLIASRIWSTLPPSLHKAKAQ